MPWVVHEQVRGDVGVRADWPPLTAGHAAGGGGSVQDGRGRGIARIVALMLLVVIAAGVIWIALEQHYQSCVQAAAQTTSTAHSCHRPF